MFSVPAWSWYPILGQKIYFFHRYQRAAVKHSGSFLSYRAPLLQTRSAVCQQRSRHGHTHTKGTLIPGTPQHKGAQAPSNTGAPGSPPRNATKRCIASDFYYGSALRSHSNGM